MKKILLSSLVIAGAFAFVSNASAAQVSSAFLGGGSNCLEKASNRCHNNLLRQCRGGSIVNETNSECANPQECCVACSGDCQTSQGTTSISAEGQGNSINAVKVKKETPSIQTKATLN